MTLQREASADAEPVIVENADGAGGVVIVCEHASNAIADRFAGLGLSSQALESHIAWDPGALEVSRHLAEGLDAPLVRATVSRLIIDCNRPFDAPDLIVSEADSFTVPGNRIDEEERAVRITTIHEPFHAALGGLISARLAVGQPTALVSVHSFTPVLYGRSRPWDVGIIFGDDRRLADRLIRGMDDDGSLVIGVNEPYSPADRVFYTHERHAEPLNLPCAMIEIRNDRIANPTSQRDMAERLSPVLKDVPESLADMTATVSHARIAKGR
jgi:predicted N-formylglutamate amidohydrolase